LKDTLMRFILI